MSKYLDFKNNIDFIKLKQTAQIIKDGGVVVFPTETVYAVGTNGLNEKSIEKLYEVKKRPENKPISLLVNSVEMIEKIAKDITPLEHKLIKKFFPGPLTIILKKKEIVPNILTSNTEFVGIRMPENEIAINLINLLGGPIAATSANISGNPSGTKIEDIINELKENVDCYIDGGISKIGVSSTVVQIIDGVPKILRKGSITEEQIKDVIL